MESKYFSLSSSGKPILTINDAVRILNDHFEWSVTNNDSQIISTEYREPLHHREVNVSLTLSVKINGQEKLVSSTSVAIGKKEDPEMAWRQAEEKSLAESFLKCLRLLGYEFGGCFYDNKWFTENSKTHKPK